MQRCYRTFKTVGNLTYTVWIVARNGAHAREIAKKVGIPTSNVITWARTSEAARYRMGTTIWEKQPNIPL